MGCIMSKRTGRRRRNNAKHKNEESATALNESEHNLLDLGKFEEMKRPQLQTLCKRFGLKASGKARNYPYESFPLWT